jgi:hypothetical protein
MKDGDRPSPFSFRIEQAPTLAARDDGSPVMSVVIAPTDAVIVRKPTGKNQKNLLAELERRLATGESLWTEKDLRSIAKALGMGKSSAITTIIGLRQLGTEVRDGSTVSIDTGTFPYPCTGAELCSRTVSELPYPVSAWLRRLPPMVSVR